MKRLTVIMAILAFCLPARAEILVFQTSTTGQQIVFNDANKAAEKKSERGYFVIDADLSTPDSVTINEALYLHYENKAGNKTQYTTYLDTTNVEMIFVNYGKNKEMVLRWFDDPTGTYAVVYGAATLKTVATGVQRYVAGTLTGCSIWRQVDFRTGSGTVKLTLDLKATSLANNTEGTTAETVIEAYASSLTLKGYSGE